MFSLSSPLAVVCHDAGAANLILPWLKDWKGEVQPYMLGPATKLWNAYFPNSPLKNSLNDALRGCETLLSGTGWATSLEHDARVMAKELKIKSVAVIDHWANYSMRFKRNDLIQLPDEIWVTDEEALFIAKKEFPNVPISVHLNVYLNEQLAKIGPPPRLDNVLYVLEPVRNDWGCGKAGEFQALEFALENLHHLSDNNNLSVILRPHPSETSDKYHAYLKQYPFIKLDEIQDLAASISKADIVIGVESFALVVALKAGRHVYSTLPPHAPKFVLPYSEIKQLRHIL